MIGIDDTVRIAAGLHVIHQLVLWLMRLGGLRISEAYGLDVEDCVLDSDGHGYLLVTDLGGRSFRQRTEDGGVEVTHKKVGGKTDAATRVVPLPRQLTEMSRPPSPPSTPTTRAGSTSVPGSSRPSRRPVGASGFRNAFNAAAGEAFDSDADLEASVVAHDLRKGYATDLAWNESISDLLARRAVGHRAGGDVFSLVVHARPEAEEASGPGGPCPRDRDRRGRRLTPGPDCPAPPVRAGCPADMVERTEAWLEVGLAGVEDGERIGVAEAARVLQMTEKATRRLMGDAIPAVKGRRGWRASRMSRPSGTATPASGCYLIWPPKRVCPTTSPFVPWSVSGSSPGATRTTHGSVLTPQLAERLLDCLRVTR